MMKNTMVIQEVTKLPKGIRFEVTTVDGTYSLMINTEKTWFKYGGEDGFQVRWVGISDEKEIKQLERLWKDVRFLG
jgi:hypothetical protein